jgi:hypothetical protein
MSHPTDKQRDFFNSIMDAGSLGAEEETARPDESTVLVLKHPCGPSVNVRGPFHLVLYDFDRDDGTKTSETVIDAKWAGAPESRAHMHLTWELVRYAKLEPTNKIVRLNIKHDWKLSLLNAAKEPLFWFYFKNERHRAYRAYSSKYNVDLANNPKVDTLVDLADNPPRNPEAPVLPPGAQ